MGTKYVPGLVELSPQNTVRVMSGVRVTDAGQLIVNAEGALAVRDTVPLKLKRLVTVTFMDTPVWPAFKSAPKAVMAKSPAETFVVVLCMIVPGFPVPVTVTVNMFFCEAERMQKTV